MRLWSDSFEDGGWIDPRNAFATAADEGHVRLSDNLNPHLAWDELPDGTKSLAIMVRDRDVPSSGEDVNQEGREVPADLPRVFFDHWALVDLPPTVGEIEEGEFCVGVTPGGEPSGSGRHGTREGINDYTGWFEGDPDMGGRYHGYDGPAPPWNDSIVHHYEFTVFALDIDRAGVEGSFTCSDLLDAIEGHVLDRATITGKYSQNPRLVPGT